VSCRNGSDLALLWLWGRPTAAALIQSLAWELPYAAGVALKSKQNSLYREQTVVARGEESWRVNEMDEGNQVVQASSYKISSLWGYNV